VTAHSGVHTYPPGMSSHGLHSETKTRKTINTAGIFIMDWPICMHVIDYIYSVNLVVNGHWLHISTAANKFSDWIEMSFIILTAT
jgi:hypothetical protein